MSAGKLVGAAVQSSFLGDSLYSTVLSRHFNYLTAEYEMKWDPVERTQGVEDFSGGDAIAGYAEGHGMKLRGHALIWHGAVPGWVNGLSAADLKTAFDHHILSVADHYRGRMLAWDVVNEAVADDGSGLRNSVFRQKLGDNYIADAFRLARQADPGALLFYNDYSGEGLGAKSDQIYELVKGLRAQGVPIDGVGLQMHIGYNTNPTAADVATNMQRLAALGLKVFISEMDVNECAGYTDAQEKAQYHDMVATCVAQPACAAVTVWGITDKYTWEDIANNPNSNAGCATGQLPAPLLLDANYGKKSAYTGVMDALLGR